MKKFNIRLTSVLLVLILLATSFIPAFALDAKAALTYSSEYNSGTRDVVCTTLDGTSAASYYANYDYDDLSELSASQLFTQLQTLMRSTHSYTSSYDDCHYKADRTDCTNGSGNVSLIYTSYSATMSQWNGWNREHVWPKSLGGNNTTGGGADLHHIRPSDGTVNSTRSNKKYGETGNDAKSVYGKTPAVGVLGGTYSSTYFEPLDNVKGDVARICLYVYVRWNSSWGATDITKVFQSVDVLLEWCEEDPVDTWEMGRNEVVQDIQGNRNVFIDYPEYAWLLFGREVPESMTTPSGEASNGEHTGGNGGSTTPTPDTPTIPDVDTPVGASATLSFASTAQRTHFSTTQQIWEQNGVKLTNDKASSTNAVADFSNPARFYKSSALTIEGTKNIAKIEVTCVSPDYATALKDSIGSEASSSDSIVTITLSTPATSYTISKLSAQVRADKLTVYYVDDTPKCEHKNTTTSTTAATCSAAGYTIVICDDCDATVSSIVIEALGHDYIDNVCVRCSDIIEYTPTTPTEGGWHLVTDASELKAGDKIVIVSPNSKGKFVAGNISNSIMASISGVGITDNAITTLPSDAVIFTLGGSSGAWTLSNAQGQKLGATAVKKLAWGSGTNTWTISISNGNATIQNATSSYGRILYNVNSPRFTTYISNTSSSMLLPQIYKYTEASTAANTEISSVSMSIGSTIAMNYYVKDFDAKSEYYMVFNIRGTDSERILGVEKNGYLVFTFTNIPPQFMGENITANLYVSGSNTPIDTLEDYSVKAYAQKLMATYGTNGALMDLVTDMLRYGAAAQMYTDYNTDDLVTEGLGISAYGSDALPSEDDDARSLESPEDISQLATSFTSAGVRFDFDNKIYVKFRTDDISKIQLKVNGKTVLDLADKVVDLGNGVCAFYSDGIKASEFGDVFTFEMYINGALHQTITYSVNSYAYAKLANDADMSSLTPLEALVLALYRYGASASAYIG